MTTQLKSILILGALTLRVGLRAGEAHITIQADKPAHRISRYLTGACIEDVNHEIYGGLYSQMIFGESFQEAPLPLSPKGPGFEVDGTTRTSNVSGMWRALRHGSAQGAFSLETQAPFVGHQSQCLTFAAGEGELGIENQGLNHWGLSLVQGRPYEGHLWARAAKPVELFVALESRDGARLYAEVGLAVRSNDWQRLDFDLTPTGADQAARFAIKLKQPGSVVLGHAFLQPGAWGRFKGLPDRKDVAEALLDQGITVLRYGGSMVNAPEYRWKNMIGPRDRRPPYHGTWYAHSSNGWGILDFLNFCEAAGFLAIPDFNLDETPQDMADFIQYIHGAANSPWGRRRAADGHPAPYRLTHIELGNEERVDETYWKKFKPLAEAIWAQNPQITLAVGDFAYDRSIDDPWHFNGAASGIINLAAHQNILRLAKEHNCEVWFDLHVGTEGPRPDSSLAATLSFIDALGGIADGARYRVTVFELNANNHSQRRALANALALNALERDGRIEVATSANCLQPDGQNDNGWNQGLLFLDPSQVWLQPPGYATRMLSHNYQPLLVSSLVESPGDNLDASAERSEDGKTLVLQVVNVSSQPMSTTIRLNGFVPKKPLAMVEELAGPLDAANTADAPNRIASKATPWRHEVKAGQASYRFAAYSFTIIRWE